MRSRQVDGPGPEGPSNRQHHPPRRHRPRRFRIAIVASLLIAAGLSGAPVRPAQAQTDDAAVGDPTAPADSATSVVAPPVEKIDPALAERMVGAKGEFIPIVVRLADSADLAELADGAPSPGQRQAKQAGNAQAVVEELIEANTKRRRNVIELLGWLEQQGKARGATPLWVVNGVATEATPRAIKRLARRRDVVSVTLDAPIAIPQSHGGAVEPNIDLVGAHGYWDLGFTGQGVVTGFIDSGADIAAGEIGSTWRGGSNSWIDFVAGSATPIDPPDSLGTPHGTVAIGVAHGDDLGGSAIGMAPGAEWVAARVFDQQRSATVSDVHAAFQWMLDPDGNPATADAPRVVNSSWVISSGTCNLEFQPDVQALVAAGILPVFAAGNQGVTSGGASPGNYPGAVAVGAVDGADVLWDDTPFGASNQGPTDCGSTGQTRTFPDLTAPGVSIKTVEGLQFYFLRSGTSVAAPHVTGGAALLLSEFPGLTLAELRAAIEAGAVDLGPSGPDDAYGNGRLDVLAARATLALAAIGDLVWSDEDGDGVLDPDEPGLEGVEVHLFGPGPDQTIGTNDDELVASATTDIVGQYLIDGLDAGTYRVTVDPSTVVAGSSLTTGNAPLDLTVATGEVRTDADFGFAPPPPASVTGTIWNDEDGNGTIGSEEPGLVGVRVVLAGRGPDGQFGTVDDTVEADAFTTTGGGYTLAGLDAGDYQVIIDQETLPAGAIPTGAATVAVTLVAGQDLTGIDVGYDVPPAGETVYVSLERKGRLPDGSRYADEDVLAWDGSTLRMFLDGSDLGLGGTDLDAVQVIDSSSVAFSVATDIDHPTLGLVDDSDIVLFTGTTGELTSGTLELYFDGSDVGLTANGEDIDGLDLLGDGTILITTRGMVRVPGLSRMTKSDILAFAPTSLGADTSGIWTPWTDGSDVGLDESTENLDAIDSAGIDLIVSATDGLDVPGLVVDDHYLALCSAWITGSDTECLWSSFLWGDDIGLSDTAHIDAVTVRVDDPDTGNGGPDTSPFVASLAKDGAVNGGALTVDELDVIAWTGSTFEMLFDASDLGIDTGDVDAVHQVDVSTLLLSFSDDMTIGDLVVDDADLVRFSGQLGPDTAGTLEIHLDGSDVGLIGSAGDIDAATMLDDGRLVVSMAGRRKVQGTTYDDGDLILLTATSLGENSAGTWELWMSGADQLLASSNSGDIDAATATGSSVSLSTRGTTPIGATSIDGHDLARCADRSGAAPCSWTVALHGALVGLGTNNIDGLGALGP